MTNPASSPASAPVPVSRWRKFSRRAALAAGGLLLLLLAAFFLLPVWISNEQGRLYVLDRLNERLHGPRVAVDAWKLGWFRTTDLINLRILAPDGSEIVKCPHVSSGLTLWDIFWSNYDIRSTTADGLELHITKYADGTTSLDSIALQEGGAGDILRAARGVLQVNDGRIIVSSVRTGQTLTYHDGRATIFIPAPDAPFRLDVKAVGDAGASLSVVGTFPPTRTLSPGNLRLPAIWAVATDVDLAATRLPTALTCDYLGVDSAWEDSLGAMLENVKFSGHVPSPAAGPTNTTHLTLQVAGNARQGEAAALTASLVLTPPAADGTGGLLTVAAPDQVSASLHQSPPLARLLQRLNPLLGEISPTPNGLLRASVEQLALPLDHPERAEMTLRVTFPPMLFATRDGPSLLRQLQVSFGEVPRPNARIEGGAAPLVVRLAEGQFHYENFLVTLGTRRINFSGSASLDGQLSLAALIPDVDAGLSASASTLVITGTTDTPLLKRPE